MIQVIDGEIKKEGLPKVGTLKNGETVSGYNLLDAETLQNEGWLPLEEEKPEINENEELRFDSFEIKEDRVIKKYIAVPFCKGLEERIKELEEKQELSDDVILTLMDVILMGGM